MRNLRNLALIGYLLTALGAPGALPAGQAGPTASIRGTVRFAGEVPPPRKVWVNKDPEACGGGEREIVEVSVTAEGLLRDVVVFIDGEIEGASPAAPVTFELRQQGCRFLPAVSYVPKNGILRIVNEDLIHHNIHAYERRGRARRDLFSFSQPEKGHTRELEIKPRRGDVVQLTCDIHNFMLGWILVPDNPFATVVADGTFALSGIPPGSRILEVFHPVLGFRQRPVELVAGETVEVDFVYGDE